MLTIDSSRIFFYKSILFFLLILINFLLISGLPLEAQAPTKKNLTSKEKTQITNFEFLKKNPWSNINGFRSAKFGIDEKSVYRAIAKDFKLAKSKVKKSTHPTEKTIILQSEVPDLFMVGGTAKVSYFLGYKSKKLMHVNITWGQGATENVDGKAVVHLANLLRDHFLKKRYKKKGLALNARISNTETAVFRGRDQKNRIIVLVITIQATKEGTPKDEREKLVSLSLSYLADAENMDIRKVKIDASEF